MFLRYDVYYLYVTSSSRFSVRVCKARRYSPSSEAPKNPLFVTDYPKLLFPSVVCRSGHATGLRSATNPGKRIRGCLDNGGQSQ